MMFKKIQANVELTDSDFNQIFTKKARDIAEIHFTPIKIAKLAATYLAAEKGLKILDVGAGTGKFCLVGATCTEGYFVGVEQRKSFHNQACRIAKKYQINNTEFICANITDISFKDFDAFYIFNPFYENISRIGKIDNDVELKPEFYLDYSEYVKNQLSLMPMGTKLVTYFSFMKEIPESYELQAATYDNKLKFWEKLY
jgi:Methyltransferase domain